MNKRGVVFAVITVILITSLCILSSHPIISCKTEVSGHNLETIKSQAKGVYSNTLPLVPVYVSVDDASGTTTHYTIYYFPFGTVGMSYTEGEGYNIEKPLTGA